MAHHRSKPSVALPEAPIHRWLVPVKSFLQIEAASGGLLLLCTVIALILANSPWAHAFESFWETELSFSIAGYTLHGHLGHLIINDALMTVFFFVVGLEVKREIVSGELQDPRKALLPIVGAIGGVIAPASIYAFLQWDQLGQRGWAIPMATDIAFVVGILALFGKRVPFGLKVFLLTLAIVDDLVAVLVIAFVFTESISLGYLGWAALGCCLTYILNKLGVRSVMIYVIIGVAIWLSFYHAGVHTTISGVILGLMTPSQAWISKHTLMDGVCRTGIPFTTPSTRDVSPSMGRVFHHASIRFSKRRRSFTGQATIRFSDHRRRTRACDWQAARDYLRKLAGGSVRADEIARGSQSLSFCGRRLSGRNWIYHGSLPELTRLRRRGVCGPFFGW
jgi:NhaA family Na+:H+ antiporter